LDSGAGGCIFAFAFVFVFARFFTFGAVYFFVCVFVFFIVAELLSKLGQRESANEGGKQKEQLLHFYF
jgi:phage-related holin